MFQVVVHTPDVVGDRMAGPGIRAWHLASELAKHFPTALVAKTEPTSRRVDESTSLRGSRQVVESSSRRESRQVVESSSLQEGVRLDERARRTLDDSSTRRLDDLLDDSLVDSSTRRLVDLSGARLLARGSEEARVALAEAAVLVGQPARGFRRRRREQRIVYDLFDPTVLELRELYGNSPSLRQRVHLAAEWWRLSAALMRADLLMCAARRQRDFYERLQSSDTRWVEVPFGVDPADFRSCEKPKDNIVLWGGGVWEWLDPTTAIDAVVRLNRSGVRAKMLFLGRSRPNRDLIDRRRDDRFDLLLRRGGEHVAANEEWIPYRERLSWLRAGKVAIMLHRRTAEAEYSIRTRLFDAIATAIPVVATSGGFAAELVEREGLGIVVPPEDTEAVATAIRRLLTDDEIYSACVQNLERIRPQYAWEVVTRPLVSAISQWLT